MNVNVVMPKTSKLWNNIVSKTDIYDDSVLLGNLKRELIDLEERLPKVKSVQEYNELSTKKNEIQIQIKELEVSIRTEPHRREEVLAKDAPKLSKLYNEEFKPFYEEYIELDKKVKEQSAKYANEISPLLERMKEIEALEVSTHSIKIFGNPEVNNFNDYMKLPIDSKEFDQQPTLYGTQYLKVREHSATTKLSRIARYLLNRKK